MTYLKLGVSALMLVCLSFQSFADENNGQQDGGVLLGASRVIYPGNNSRGVTLTVSNQVSHPFLVKSMVLDESRQHGAPFIVTPPLFRLDGGQRNTLTITRTGGRFPADREALNAEWCLYGAAGYLRISPVTGTGIYYPYCWRKTSGTALYYDVRTCIL
ncbi:fimbria/pilus periplasmic chaperone [Salmonella enterica]|nr:fimbria/pilus periplasmic chaperone [Salmonella enterica]